MLAGLDLARTRDFAALATVEETPVDGITYTDIRINLWVPQATIPDKESNDKIPLSAWIDSGHVIACPGDEIDAGMILPRIVDLHAASTSRTSATTPTTLASSSHDSAASTAASARPSCWLDPMADCEPASSPERSGRCPDAISGNNANSITLTSGKNITRIRRRAF